MKKTVILYGILLALLLWALKWMEYRYILRDLSLQFYLGLVAVLFSGLGVWAGLQFLKPQSDISDQHPKVTSPPNLEASLHALGISPREYEVLQLMAAGLSNQEIADRLFISLNTVKTHISSLYLKLDAQRRTQAIQKAKEHGLLSL
ncbi:MAG: response regulator transcription factor [Saprospiraceae bacterium]|nr:response regulator transcription factor [Saprospiraceae bacterium]